MPPPAPLRPLVARSTLLLIAGALAGCGNRGELYLAPDADRAVEADLERLGGAEPTLVPGLEARSVPLDPAPIVPGEGLAPSVDPTPGTAPGTGDEPARGGDEGGEKRDGQPAGARRPPGAPATDDAER